MTSGWIVTSLSPPEVEAQELERLRRVCSAERERLRHFWAEQQKIRDRRLVGLGFFTYDHYRLDDEYRRRLSSFTAAAAGRCEVCRDRPRELEVHHLHYETLGNESRDDLLVLCPQCHRAAHDGPRPSPAR